MIMTRLKLPLINRIAGISIFLYFIAILVSFVTDFAYRRELYYLSTALCIGVFFIWKTRNGKLGINGKVFIFIMTCVLSGLLNFAFVGNTTLKGMLECAIADIIIGCMLIEIKIDKKYVFYALSIYCACFSFLFLTHGIGSRLLSRYSNNFVSIILIYPVVIYYALAEQYHEKPSFIPAFFVWLLSLLAAGRSGILATSILFAFVFLRSVLKEDKTASLSKVRLKRLIKLFLLIVAGILIIYVTAQYASIFFRKFVQRGINNDSRALIWKDYFHSTDCLKDFILGTPVSDQIAGTVFNGNLHNSFFNIHAKNGVFTLLAVGILLINSIFYAKRNGMMVYIVCLITFCARGFFDNVFWGPTGTSVFMYFILFPILHKQMRSKKYGDLKR